MKRLQLLFRYHLLPTILLLAVVLVIPVNARAATYDASGTWLYWITANYTSSYDCGSNDSIGFGSITQNGNSVQMVLNGKTYNGTVSGATYTFNDTYPEGDGTTSVVVQFTLRSSTYAKDGMVAWEYSEGGFVYCWGYDDLELEAVAAYDDPPAYFNTSGIWDYNIVDQWNNCGDPTDALSGITSINQNGSTFTYSDDFGIHKGVVSNDKYLCTLTYPEEGGMTYETTYFQLLSNSSGVGLQSWTWVEGSYSCSGGGTYTMTKRTGGATTDYSGLWTVTLYPPGEDPFSVNALFSQEGNTITWVNPFNEFTASGFVSGTDYTVIGSYTSSYNDFLGTMTESLIFNPSTLTGELTWTWTGGGLPEYGTIPFTLYDNGYFINIPNKPTLISPVNNLTNVSLTPVLVSGSYSHANSEATHTLTEWQISTDPDLFSTVFQKVSNANLLSLQVPRYTLEPGTDYYWRVRHFDYNYQASLWSNTRKFTTTTTTNDQDDDGIPDAQELPSNSTVDLDNDDTYDVNQARYKVLKNINGNPVGISHKLSNTVSSIDEVEAVDPDAVSNIFRPVMPDGLLTIISTVATPTDNGEYTVYFSSAVPEGGKWFMHNPVDGWVDYSEWATFAPDGMSVTLQLKDWGFGDADGIPNGRVVDPGGVGFPTFMDVSVKDALTGDTIIGANVTIGDATLNTADCTDGLCHTMVVPGTYDISVTAEGFNAYVEHNFTISEGGNVAKNFSVRPSGAGALSAILALLLE